MREVGCTPTRIPSRLGEPGSLFSRYKFLQLGLVVVTLLTRTRRELLKRRANDRRAYIFGGFLKPRVTRRPTTSFLFIPRCTTDIHPSPASRRSPRLLSFIRFLPFFPSFSFINKRIAVSWTSYPHPLEGNPVYEYLGGFSV